MINLVRILGCKIHHRLEIYVGIILLKSVCSKRTRTKTSIRYAKENDKEKRERRKERERKVEGKREKER